MRRRYDRQGLLAFDPKAFFFLFDEPAEREVKMRGDAAIVDISGPLDHHAGWWCDSYDEILERVEKACESSAKAVVLKIDSPGGMVSGLFETSQAIREKCAAAGKQLIAYVEGNACSAAYALACCAQRIAVASTGVVGSIGVIDTRVDVSAMDAAMGVKFAFVTSGTHKADGNPHLPIGAAELAERQKIVDTFAGVFFEHVAAMRGLDAKRVSSLEARIFPGATGVAAGLADEVTTFDALLASLAGAQEQTMSIKASKLSDARSALEEAAKGDDEEAKKAKRALAAMDEEEKKDDDSEKESKAEGDDEEKKDEPAEGKKEASAAGSVSASTAGSLAAIVEEQGRKLAALQASNEKIERDALLASRSDLTKELRALLESKPLAEVKQILAAMPKSVPNHAATVVVPSERGDGKHAPAAAPKTSQQVSAEEMDLRMGLAGLDFGVRKEGTSLVFGAMKPSEAAAANKTTTKQ